MGFESVEKSAKKSPQKSYRPKTFACSNKSQKLHFAVTFYLITFFARKFCATFSTDLNSASNSEFFDAHIAILKEKNVWSY
jgi:hypothetical protein